MLSKLLLALAAVVVALLVGVLEEVLCNPDYLPREQDYMDSIEVLEVVR